MIRDTMPMALRAVVTLAFVAAATTSLSVGASQSDELETAFRGAVDQVTASFEQELKLELDTAIRPPVFLEQNRVAAVEVDSEAQEPSSEEIS